MIAAIPAQSFVELIVIVNIAQRPGRAPKAGIALYPDAGNSARVESSCDADLAEEVRAGRAFAGAVLGRTAKAKPNDIHQSRRNCPRMLSCGHGSCQRIQRTGKRKETPLYRGTILMQCIY